MMSIDLRGRVALVVGGSRGIGGGITEALCQCGASVVFTHTGNPRHSERLAEFAAELSRLPGRAVPVVADASSASDTNRAVRTVMERFGRIDHVVCNAGQNQRRPVEEVTDASWRHFIDVNLSSAFYAVRAAIPHMLQAGYGRIVLIGSSVVYDGGGGAIDYAAAKSALQGMMTFLMRNYARQGIVTNLIHPCVIDTDLFRERYADEASRQKVVSDIPAGRLGTPQDIACLVSFLLSPLGEFIAGQSILVDGGRTMF